VRNQPFDATPSDINLFSKGGVYDTRETGVAFCLGGLATYEKSLPGII
jgi:hypothetical protein